MNKVLDSQVTQSIYEVWIQFPELRLGQLIENAIRCGGALSPLYYMEDMELIQKLKNYAQVIRDIREVASERSWICKPQEVCQGCEQSNGQRCQQTSQVAHTKGR